MEHESFVDPNVARFLNEHFVNIKVDREERPDLDQLYMNAVVALTGHGGWPMSVFLTPDLKPFYGGTYFPPEDRYGMPSFSRILHGVLAAWRDRRADVLQSAQAITQHIAEAVRVEPNDTAVSEELLRNAAAALRQAFDANHGGFGRAPKFPHPFEIQLLLRLWKRFGDAEALQMAETTLDHMARGGIYDHLGGGFHRYSTDPQWLVPHFEKMLYDNALLSQCYLAAHQATGNPFYRHIAEETLEWVRRDMTSPEGAFYSTLDADSEGEEGRFYVWTWPEVNAVLGQETELFATAYDVSAPGNWEGRCILHRPKPPEQEAKLAGLAVEVLERRLTAARLRLFAVREQRVRPGRDEKILAAWNGLMIAAFAKAAQIIDPSYAQAAEKAAAFVLNRMRDPHGKLLRSAGFGVPAKFNGYLEDYAYLIDGLITLFEATGTLRWLQAAIELTEVMLDQFADVERGGFFYVGRDHETLLLRLKDAQDNATPSGNSLATMSLLRLAHLTGRTDWELIARRTLDLFAGQMAATPLAFGQMLAAVDFVLGPVTEFVVVEGNDPDETTAVLSAIGRRFQPNQVVLRRPAGPLDADLAAHLPLFQGKNGKAAKPTVYVCRGHVCREPAVGLAAVEAALQEATNA
jgi:uncharacterized protein YyaL (SSP411 family)